MHMPRWQTLPHWVRAIVILDGVLIVFVIFLRLWQIADPTTAEERINTFQIMVTIVGGTVVGVGSYIAWQNLRLNRENVRQSEQMNRETLRITEAGQITERFTRAIDQLGASDDEGNPRLEIRLGGIYALERIARDSDRDHQPIMETLTSYLRQHTSRTTDHQDANKPTPLREDIAAIVEVLRRRHTDNRTMDRFALNLRETNLHGADLRKADLVAAHLSRTNLAEADLEGTNLERAILFQAGLARAIIKNASLTGADLRGAVVAGAILNGADLRKADFSAATLTGASLMNACFSETVLLYTNLSGANLRGADLRNAELNGANLSRALLMEADLRGTDLKHVNLTESDLSHADLTGACIKQADFRGAIVSKSQLLSAIGDDTTKHDFGGALWPATGR